MDELPINIIYNYKYARTYTYLDKNRERNVVIEVYN